jgi:hypothetical protein
VFEKLDDEWTRIKRPDHPHGADVGREEPPERADIIVHIHWESGLSNQRLNDGVLGASWIFVECSVVVMTCISNGNDHTYFPAQQHRGE